MTNPRRVQNRAKHPHVSALPRCLALSQLNVNTANCAVKAGAVGMLNGRSGKMSYRFGGSRNLRQRGWDVWRMLGREVPRGTLLERACTHSQVRRSEKNATGGQVGDKSVHARCHGVASCWFNRGLAGDVGGAVTRAGLVDQGLENSLKWHKSLLGSGVGI
ncbi:hypothetical protein BDK51DRAFT_35406 [Blyttiomyces helicus]|uniref:Uncharacterized protein n=1 Tax=Blyttiomyces helicus TaxID=388810 RepID=A0A4P9WR82_9FUNG|nr:hypothetical protein BDK51DRAFT_35406 [Blyttiomyces helicus]|eukprot:RKO93740.1 hypothetical protein BDK51DRAFT_35406 [Blyttiomyces helicus]